MNIASARLLIENLLERIELDPATAKFKLGTISNKEKLALETLLCVVVDGRPAELAAPEADQDPVPLPAQPQAVSRPEPEEHTVSPIAEISLSLDIRSLERSKAEDPRVTVCLDFGTAMSKAFAIKDDMTPIELALG